jgi:2-polyprenyl-3-methyl-5-hydroxy-6-metoxy-1,4-benzoquinol methylase
VSEELSGDVELSVGDRCRYLWRNLRRNAATIGRGPRTRAFPVIARDLRGRLCGQSPSRLLTELFIERELPRLLTPGEITVFEIGCGSGSLLRRLAALGYRGRYIGVDLVDRFRRDHATTAPFTVDFIHADAHAVTPGCAVDLVISISAIEHIPRDAELLRRVTRFVRPGGLQLHVVPAAAGLFAYLWHGYRQYTPASLAERFGAETIELIALGGVGTFMVHLGVITIPEILLGYSLRTSAPSLYAALVRAGITLDRRCSAMPTAFIVVRRH